jgi:hypothetical protein
MRAVGVYDSCPAAGCDQHPAASCHNPLRKQRVMTDSINSKKPSGIPPGRGSINRESTIMTITTSRRAILAGAAILPALAVPSAFALPAIAQNADADGKLIALGERFEKLLLEYTDATFQWAPLLRAAHAEIREKFNFVNFSELSEKQYLAARRLLNRITKHNGCNAASNRASAIFAEMKPIAEKIVEAPASSLGGLRAKALVVLWESRPIHASHEGNFNFPKDGGASRSLFYAVAALTGLAAMVKEIEVRLAADADASDSAEVRS